MSENLLGFIGLGNMGFYMASNLIKEGEKLAIYDINPAAMERFPEDSVVRCSSPKEVANISKVVLTSLPTPEVVKTVALGEEGIISGSKIETYIDLSSSGREVSQYVGEQMLLKNIGVLDAPVSGGVPGAQNGTITIMAAGEQKLYLKQKELLEKFSKKVFFVDNTVGSAQVMKVINNLLSSTALAVTSEAMVLGVKAGLDPDIMIDVLNASSGRNSATEDKFKKSILNRRFDYGFSDTLAYKDMKLCMDLSNELGVPMFMSQNIVNFWKFVVTQGEPGKDYTNVIKYIENWSDVVVESIHERERI